jgi:hypothetical protein
LGGGGLLWCGFGHVRYLMCRGLNRGSGKTQ